MSVYSGFATRKQELLYAELSETLVQALVKRITKFYQGASCNEEVFCESVRKIYMNMAELEPYKVPTLTYEAPSAQVQRVPQASRPVAQHQGRPAE